MDSSDGIRNSPFDVFVVIVFGIAGYGMKRLDYPSAPLLFGFVLGPPVEDHLQRALLLGHGNLTAFVASPISAGFLLAALAAGVWASGGGHGDPANTYRCSAKPLSCRLIRRSVPRSCLMLDTSPAHV